MSDLTQEKLKKIIHYNSTTGKWLARIKVNGDEIHLGNHNKKETAIMIRKAAECWFGFHANHGRNI